MVERACCPGSSACVDGPRSLTAPDVVPLQCCHLLELDRERLQSPRDADLVKVVPVLLPTPVPDLDVSTNVLRVAL